MRASLDNGQWLNTTANDLTVPVSATGFAAAFSALGVTTTSAQPAAQHAASDQPTSPMLTASTPPRNGVAPRELPEDLYEIHGRLSAGYAAGYRRYTSRACTPSSTASPAISASDVTLRPVGACSDALAIGAWRSAALITHGAFTHEWTDRQSGEPRRPHGFLATALSTGGVCAASGRELRAFVHGFDPSTVLDALRQSGFVDEADLRIAEGILALTDRVTSSTTVAIEDYRQAFLLYLLYHRSHLGI